MPFLAEQLRASCGLRLGCAWFWAWALLGCAWLALRLGCAWAVHGLRLGSGGLRLGCAWAAPVLSGTADKHSAHYYKLSTSCGKTPPLLCYGNALACCLLTISAPGLCPGCAWALVRGRLGRAPAALPPRGQGAVP